MTKPFSRAALAPCAHGAAPLVAHVPKAERLSFEVLDLDARTREVTSDGELLRLTAREFDLLWFLASHPKQVFSREQLMDRSGATRPRSTPALSPSTFRRLREKIEADPAHPRFLQTVWGVGYRFSP